MVNRSKLAEYERQIVQAGNDKDARDGFANKIPEKIVCNQNYLCSKAGDTGRFTVFAAAVEGKFKDQKEQEKNSLEADSLVQDQTTKYYSVRVLERNKKMDSLLAHHPQMWYDRMVDLKELRERLLILLFALKRNGRESSKEYRATCRKNWVVQGAIEHGFDPWLLNKVVQKYTKIDAVPNHYYQAELYEGKQLLIPKKVAAVAPRRNQ